MKKIIKMLLVIFILSLIISSFYCVNASDINMNLTTDDSTTYGSNTANNTVNTNNSTVNNSQNSSVLVSSTPSNALDGLTLSDTINIILCAIGIVLILLGIAILIRQKAQ